MAEETLAERIKRVEGERQTRTERELERIETEGQAEDLGEPAKPKAKPKESIGVGRNDSRRNADRLIAQLRTRIAATADADLKTKLEERIKAIEATVTE